MARCFYLIFLIQLWVFNAAAVQLLSLAAMNQSGAALASAYNGTTKSESPPEATALSGPVFPTIYYVRYTNPLIIFRLSPSIHIALLPYPLAYTVIYGLNAIVECCIFHKEDANIPAGGLTLAPASVGISIKALAPGTAADITYSMAAAILRGIFELTAFHGSYTLETDIFVGAITRAQFRGHASVYVKLGDGNSTLDLLLQSSQISQS